MYYYRVRNELTHHQCKLSSKSIYIFEPTVSVPKKQPSLYISHGILRYENCTFSNVILHWLSVTCSKMYISTHMNKIEGHRITSPHDIHLIWIRTNTTYSTEKCTFPTISSNLFNPDYPINPDLEIMHVDSKVIHDKLLNSSAPGSSNDQTKPM